MYRNSNSNWLPSLFNDILNDWTPAVITNGSAVRTAPAFNVIENENNYQVEVAAPGMTKDDFKIHLDDENRLIVRLQKKTEQKEEDKARKYDLPSEALEELHLLLTRRDAYVRVKRVIQSGANEIPKRDKQGETVTLIKASTRHLLKEIDDEIDRLEKRMEEIVAKEEAMQKNYEILRSFTGIGIVNSMCFITYTYNFKKFDLNARKIATYWGVAPFGKDSGKTVHVGPHVSNFCNHWLKAILSNAANSAIVWNPIIKPYYERLKKAGKCEGICRNNVKNKIIQTITAMIRKGEKFDPEFIFTNKNGATKC